MYKNAENKFSARVLLYSNIHRLFKDIFRPRRKFLSEKAKIFCPYRPFDKKPAAEPPVCVQLTLLRLRAPLLPPPPNNIEPSPRGGRAFFVRTALFAKNLPQSPPVYVQIPFLRTRAPLLFPEKALRPPLAGRALFSAATAFPLRPCALFSFPSSASCGTVRGDGCCARCGSPATMPPRRWRRRRRWYRPTGPRARETYHSR